MNTAGANTITLTPCPVGVDTVLNDKYSVHIGTVGTPEDVQVTGGTCTSGGASGTITVVTTNAHAPGYTVTSSSAGFQEASNAASFTPTNPSGTNQSGVVVLAPGEYTWTATVYAHKSSQVLDFSGTVIACNMAAPCLYLSTPTLGANGTNNITVNNFRGKAMISGGGFPMIEDNANSSRLLHLTTRDAPSCTPFCAFSNLVKIDNDQNFLIDGLDDSAGGWNICNATNGCSVDVLIAGSPFAGTGVIENSNFSAGCGSNYVNDLANNTLSIRTSVMQGWNSYAVQFGGPSGGGLNPELVMDHVYMEGAVCTNYLGLTGNAGILNEGGTLTQRGATGASSAVPYFTNTGSTTFYYYVVVHSSTAGTSLPIFAGYATVNTTLATNIPVTFYQVGSTGTITYDLLRLSGSNQDGPTGTGNFAVATGQTVAGVCSSSVCTINDTANVTPSSYAVPNQTYIPRLTYWPMAVVLTTGTDNAIPLAVGNLFEDRVAKGNAIVVTDMAVPHMFGAECLGGSFPIPGMASCSAGDSVGNNNPAVQGTIFESGPVSGGMTSNLKGRVILTESFLASLAPTDLITVVDSKPIRTSSNILNRPSADTGDTAVCSDASASLTAAQLCLRAPIAISEYINSLPDNVHFLERLTATNKTFNVPVSLGTAGSIVGTLNVTNATSGTIAVAPPTGALGTPTLTWPALTGSLSTGYTCGTITANGTCANTSLAGSGHWIAGIATLSVGASTITGITPAFTSSSSFFCVTNDITTITNPSKGVPASASSVTFTGTGTDKIQFYCAGN